jgi:transposase
MGREFRPYEPDQSYLLPPSLREWLPEEHLAFFVSDAVDAMNLSAFVARYGDDGPGNQAFDPRMMVKVLLYSYASGTFSSRGIAAKLHEDVALRVLGAGNFPAHRTIADFRVRHLEEFQDLFVQVVQMAREAGLVKLGTVAIDGTKVRANASKRKAMTYGRMKSEEKRLRKEIRDLTRRAGRTDEQEDKAYGKDRRGDELPVELSRREDRLAAIQAAKKRLEERQAAEDREQGREPGDQDRTGKSGTGYKRAFGEPKEKAQESFTDTDSRIMKHGAIGFQQSYNAQVAVDEEARLIIVASVTQKGSDVGELASVLDEVETNTGELPERVLADAGYKSESNLRMLEERKVDGYIALGREGTGPKPIASDKVATQRMARKLRTKRGRKRYAKRKHIGEPPFGWIKHVIGFRTFSMRGLHKVGAEWNLVTLATNLRRLNGKMVWV